MLDCEPALSSDGVSLKLYIFGSGIISVQLVAPQSFAWHYKAYQRKPSAKDARGMRNPAVHQLEHLQRFGELGRREDRVQFRQLRRVQRMLERANVLLHAHTAAALGDHDDIVLC